MDYDVISAEYVDDYRLRICFRNGKSGIVDLKKYIDKGGVFEGLKDIAAFRDFKIDAEWHTISWQDGHIDVTPETLYAEATGEKPLSRVAEECAPYDGVEHHDNDTD